MVAKIQKIIISIPFLLMTCFSISPLARADGPSEAGLFFLKIAPNARASGMGEAFVAVVDDATATWWNPAALAFVSRMEIAGHYNKFQYIDDVAYTFGSISIPVASLNGVLGASYTNMNHGTTQGRTEWGTPAGLLHSYDRAVGVSFGMKLNPRLALGLAGKYIYSHLMENPATTFAVDLGVMYRCAFLEGLTTATTVTNMGPAISYTDYYHAAPLPMTLRLGASYKRTFVTAPFTSLEGVFSFDLEKELVDRYENGQARPFYESLFSSWTNNSTRNEFDGVIRHFGAEGWWIRQVSPTFTLKLAGRAGYYFDVLGRQFPKSIGFSLAGESDSPEMSISGRFDFAYLSAADNFALDNTNLFSVTLGISPSGVLKPLLSHTPALQSETDTSSKDILPQPQAPDSLARSRVKSTPVNQSKRGVSFSLNGGIAELMNEGSNIWNLGFFAAGHLFYKASTDFWIGGRLAYNRWTLNINELIGGSPPPNGIDYDITGTATIVEIGPSIRLLSPPSSETKFFAQSGCGLYRASGGVEGEITYYGQTLIKFSSGEPETKFGLNLGIGITKSKGGGFELILLYHNIFTEAEPVKILTAGLGMIVDL